MIFSEMADLLPLINNIWTTLFEERWWYSQLQRNTHTSHMKNVLSSFIIYYLNI
ncbi:unnamed protein product [Arabidopsis halleri]